MPKSPHGHTMSCAPIRRSVHRETDVTCSFRYLTFKSCVNDQYSGSDVLNCKIVLHEVRLLHICLWHLRVLKSYTQIIAHISKSLFTLMNNIILLCNSSEVNSLHAFSLFSLSLSAPLFWVSAQQRYIKTVDYAIQCQKWKSTNGLLPLLARLVPSENNWFVRLPHNKKPLNPSEIDSFLCTKRRSVVPFSLSSLWWYSSVSADIFCSHCWADCSSSLSAQEKPQKINQVGKNNQKEEFH